ncbi:MAG: tetratricopeptide repeat protein [Candidatus Sericytochromatia bacterium]|nr:tetratricopeptide repeat protein [Candidatus Sericytochromatia bacterium]
MKRILTLILCLGVLSAPALAAPPKPKGKPSPSAIPSEMPTFQNERIKFGEGFLKKKDYRQAEQEFRSATRIDPNSFAAAVGLGDALYGRKLYKESLDEYMRAMRLVRPTYAVVPLQAASKLVREGKMMQALTVYQQIAHIKPAAGELLNKGVTALQNGDKTGAKKAFTEALKLDPDYADAHYKLGNMAYEAKVYVDAIAAYEAAVKAAPTDGLIHFKLGNAYYRFQTVAPKGDKYAFYRAWDRKTRDAKWASWCTNKAAVAYRQANKLRPKDFDILYNLGVSEFYLKRYPDAIAVLQAAVLVRNDDPDAHTYLGNAWFQKAHTIKEYNKAIHEYKVAQNLDPKRFELEYNLGQAYMQKSKLHPESDEFEITPANQQLYYAKGAAYHKTHMLEETAKHFEIYLASAAASKNRDDVTKMLTWVKAESSRTVQSGHGSAGGAKPGAKPGGHGGH